MWIVVYSLIFYLNFGRREDAGDRRPNVTNLLPIINSFFLIFNWI